MPSGPSSGSYSHPSPAKCTLVTNKDFMDNAWRPKLQYVFKVGEAALGARLKEDDDTYLADGTVLWDGNEILLFEASGPFNNKDILKLAYDVVKGSFSCTTMGKSILRKYHHADIYILIVYTCYFYKQVPKMESANDAQRKRERDGIEDMEQ
ncbi:hypothetical protein BDA99DRAFT_563066 [Phascolomyces articulosus]|uniref:Uncharacterized protein n=1 Tax=Phascolomyces articulosus TaxID=60185 RepID=A0AAD5JTB5_9FUNG|nr:hypothetical protein BDA99DRAFT_563066 [Phascolomyces articulosus]